MTGIVTHKTVTESHDHTTDISYFDFQVLKAQKKVSAQSGKMSLFGYHNTFLRTYKNTYFLKAVRGIKQPTSSLNCLQILEWIGQLFC